MTLLVTGGAGFIGTNFVHSWLAQDDIHKNEKIINLDKLTYAGNLQNLNAFQNDKRHIFVEGDIGDNDLVSQLLEKYSPRAILNFAAESHVDRSISGPRAFIETNINATFNLLETVLKYYESLTVDDQAKFRFLHISTDEVYGSLGPNDPAFKESNPYEPNSVYSASKAASDHLVRAYHHTYGLPTLTTNCSNNYGPYQFPEKLIPLMIHNALTGKNLPIYGDGKNIRDWLHVEDHCEAIRFVLAKGQIGETYNIGGSAEMMNIDVVETICDLLDELSPKEDGTSYKAQKSFVEDRKGHDRRYAVDTLKIKTELGWTPHHNFTSGIRNTIQWYLDNQDWVANVTSGAYRDWIKERYAA